MRKNALKQVNPESPAEGQRYFQTVHSTEPSVIYPVDILAQAVRTRGCGTSHIPVKQVCDRLNGYLTVS